MICPNCRKEVLATDNYCQHCGEYLDKVLPSPKKTENNEDSIKGKIRDDKKPADKIEIVTENNTPVPDEREKGEENTKPRIIEELIEESSDSEKKYYQKLDKPRKQEKYQPPKKKNSRKLIAINVVVTTLVAVSLILSIVALSIIASSNDGQRTEIIELDKKFDLLEDQYLQDKQAELAPKDPEKDPLQVIDEYINAVRIDDFSNMKNNTDKNALDFVKLQEFERNDIDWQYFKAFEKYESEITSINETKAKGYMHFKERIINDDKSFYDLESKGPVFLEIINETWKIVDYERQGDLISECLFSFDGNILLENDYMEISIEDTMFNLSEKTVSVKFEIENKTNSELSLGFKESWIVGLGQKEFRVIDHVHNDLNAISRHDTIKGNLYYDWGYELPSSFIINLPAVKDIEGELILSEESLPVELSAAKRY